MFANSSASGLFDVLPLNRQPGSAWSGGVLLVCLLMAVPGALTAANSTLGDEQPALLSDDGFTRETLTEFNAPEPAPFAVDSAASVEAMHRRHYAKTASRHRHQLQRERAAQHSSSVIVVKAAPRRNPVESFVFWWNGWVIDTFHTKIGTVMLGDHRSEDIGWPDAQGGLHRRLTGPDSMPGFPGSKEFRRPVPRSTAASFRAGDRPPTCPACS